MKNAEGSTKLEHEQAYKPFDFINKDLDLLFLLIILEGFKQGKTVYRLTDFFKGNFWDIHDVKAEAFDTNDYAGIPDMALDRVIRILEDLRLGAVVSIGLDDIDAALQDVLIEIAEMDSDEAKEQAGYYADVVKQIRQLDVLRQKKPENVNEENPESSPTFIKDNGVSFTPDKYFEKLQSAILHSPGHILITISYDPTQIAVIEDEIKRYLDQFAADEFIDQPAPYQDKRFYFTRQLESFHGFISKLALIGDTVNIPFSILNEQDFEAVKILRYLEINGSIKIRWADEGSWKVQFAEMPSTPNALLKRTASDLQPAVDTEAKSETNFDLVLSMLTIGEYATKIKGPDQRLLLKILFKEKDREWFYSEIAEQYDHEADVDEKKFYNAAYQVNGNIAKNTLIKDFLITTKQTVQINPKYLPKT